MIFDRVNKIIEPTENKLFSTIIDFQALRIEKENTHDFNCEYCGIDTNIVSFSESSSFKKPFLINHDIMINKHYHVECKRLHKIESVKRIYKPQSKQAIEIRKSLKRIDILKKQK